MCTLACAETPATAPQYRVVELPSPAGPTSGQPTLETTEEGVLLAWTEAAEDGEHRLVFAELHQDAWGPNRVIVQRDSLFVNWADFSLLRRTPSESLVAHWLVRYPRGGTSYRIEAAFSDDGGETWSDPWTPHEDGTATEHGFVSWVAMPDGGTGLAWLDGRGYDEMEGASHGGDGHGGPNAEMSLRFRSLTAEGTPSEEVVLDARTCDCCQTAALLTSRGPIVAYRDRSEDEIRDIAVVRWSADGWSDPARVHDDGWRIPGCPVNGPALAGSGERVGIAWFTAAGDTPRVKGAFSHDAGATFGDPVVIDDGHPEGRVDTLMTPDGDLWVAWLERTPAGADVRLRRLDSDGTLHPSLVVAASSESRAAGFPRMAFDPVGRVVLAWTDPGDPSQVRVVRVEAVAP